MTDDQLIENELVRCNRCGYCMSTCPAYHVDLDESQTARGRLALLEALREGQLEQPGRDLAEAFSGCLLCGACSEACFSGVRTDDLMVRARAALKGGRRGPSATRLLTHQLLLRPRRMTALMRLAGTGRRAGLVGLARRVSPLLNLAETLAEPAPRRFLRDRLTELGFRPEPGQPGVLVLPRDPAALRAGPRVLYFIGCGTNYQLPEPGAAALRVLARAGCEVVVCPHVCCGLPPYSYGDLPSAQALARRNVELLGAVAAEYVVTECGSCGRFLKRYPELLAETPAAAAAQALGARVRDFTELLGDLRLPAPVRPLGEVVTYHDPCHLGRGQGVTEAPRRLLREAAGARLVELPEADWCCGGAGTYNLAHPERAGEILRRKVDNIRRTGASVVATACPACVVQIRHGLRQSGSATRVRHVAEVVAEAQGLIPKSEK
jgi:glycolate oxidase iron-sulfur subunit